MRDRVIIWATVRRQSLLRAILIGIIDCVIFTSACHKHRQIARAPQTPAPANQPGRSRTQSKSSASTLAVSIGYTEQGVASWYGVPYHGRPAADGEIYDMETLVAAHRLLPFNTWLKVTNLANNKSVNVRVIDRGPFVAGRILDLSRAAAREIDLLGPGIGTVRFEVISAPLDNPATDFYAVQIGAFSVYDNAERLRSQYAQRFGEAHIAVKQGTAPVYRVVIGKEPSIDAAQQLAIVLAAEEKNVFVVRLDPSAPAPSAMQ